MKFWKTAKAKFCKGDKTSPERGHIVPSHTPGLMVDDETYERITAYRDAIIREAVAEAIQKQANKLLVNARQYTGDKKGDKLSRRL